MMLISIPSKKQAKQLEKWEQKQVKTNNFNLKFKPGIPYWNKAKSSVIREVPQNKDQSRERKAYHCVRRKSKIIVGMKTPNITVALLEQSALPMIIIVILANRKVVCLKNIQLIKQGRKWAMINVSPTMRN